MSLGSAVWVVQGGSVFVVEGVVFRLQTLVCEQIPLLNIFIHLSPAVTQLSNIRRRGNQ